MPRSILNKPVKLPKYVFKKKSKQASEQGWGRGVGKNDILYEVLETISVDPCAYLSKWSRYAHEVGTLKNKTKKTKPIRLREKTKYCDRVVLNRTLVTRGFFSRAAGCFGVGCRPTDLTERR